MKSNDTSHTTRSTVNNGQPSDAAICIIGVNQFNNEILSGFLESQTGLPCHCARIPISSKLCQQFSGKTALLILDCNAMGKPKLCETDIITQWLQSPHNMILCINVDPGANLEHKAMEKGVRGIIYNHRPIDLYPRACQAVLNGELWYPRRILNERFLSTAEPTPLPEKEGTGLTQREREILRLLSLGLRNHEIAKKLCISPHTVKTHAYNLYKKIQVGNRFQAAQWLSENRTIPS